MLSIENEHRMEKKKERFHGIPMLPDGLLSARMKDGEKRKDIQITELAEEGFCFRTVQGMCSPDYFEISFYDMDKTEYSPVMVTDFEIQVDKTEDFFTGFTVWTGQENYRHQVQKLAQQYGRYIRLKLEDDGELEKELTGYPSEQDEEHWNSLDEQKRYWFAESEDRPGIQTGIPESTEFALEIDHPELYEAYLRESLEDFYRSYLEKNYVCGSGLEKCLPERLYIGNQFCHLLFPKEDLLFAMLEKAKREHTAVTLSFTYVRETMLSENFALLKKLDCWCERNAVELECVVNDWGMADFIKKETRYLSSCLGTLLNKRKKDPRISFKKGNRSLYEQNSFNADFYREFLRDSFGIKRTEWEVCGYMQEIPERKNSLHFPFFQTNTSQYCPLYAVKKEGDRGRQRFIQKCPQYCEESAFLYPKHLNMIGKYNSLFALDRAFLEDSEQLKTYADSGVDRVVLNLL